IYYTAAIMGPAIGLILGGTFLKMYTDVSVDAARDYRVQWWRSRSEVDTRALKGDSVQVRLVDMPKAVCGLLRNYTFLFISLAATVETMLGSGLSNFGAKLFESEFGMTSANAALVLGTIGIPSACSGCFLGGYVVSKLNLSCASIIRMCAIVSLFNWFVFFALLSSCPDIKFEGVDMENKM
ncbi:hypothetical protein MTO96_045606, partial [Rhipicephalus appendiculatus]